MKKPVSKFVFQMQPAALRHGKNRLGAVGRHGFRRRDVSYAGWGRLDDGEGVGDGAEHPGRVRELQGGGLQSHVYERHRLREGSYQGQVAEL